MSTFDNAGFGGSAQCYMPLRKMMLLITINQKIVWETIPERDFIKDRALIHHVVTNMNIIEFITAYDAHIEAACKQYSFAKEKMQGSFEIMSVSEFDLSNADINILVKHRAFRHICVKIMLREDNKAINADHNGGLGQAL